MKRGFFFCSTVVVVVLMLVMSCNNESEKADKSVVVNEPDLLETLDAFNSSLLSTKGWTAGRFYDYRTNTSVPVTKVSGTVVATALADLKGAYSGGMKGMEVGAWFGPHSAVIGGVLGGVVCGTIGSLVAYEATKAGTVDIDPVDLLMAYQAVSPTDIEAELNIENTDVNFPQEYEESYSTGAMHNILLSKCLSGEIGDNNDQIDEGIDEEMLQIIESPIFQAAYDESSAVQENMFLLDEAQYPMKFMQVANLFMEIFALFPESISDVDFVINEYISRIEAFDELSESEKDILYSAFGVATSSVRFWN